ncbi:MAG: hypothetical protein IKF71_04340 [Bacilli bacterium]|nr:hypothetical protein [Bacilli bacterium]
MKNYANKALERINIQLDDTQKKRKWNKILNNIGTGLAAVIGTCMLFSSPWFGLSLIGGAISFQLSRKTKEANLNIMNSSLLSQKNNINRILSGEINPTDTVTPDNRNRIEAIRKDKRELEAQNISSKANHNLAQALVAGTIVLSGLFPNPFFTIATAGSIGLKHFAAKTSREKNEAYEETSCYLNNTINSYNMGAIMINKGVKQTRRRAVESTQVKENNNSRRAARVVSMEEENAVDQYIRSLEEQEEKERRVPRRRI